LVAAGVRALIASAGSRQKRRCAARHRRHPTRTCVGKEAVYEITALEKKWEIVETAKTEKKYVFPKI
jgi:hypothetical protein